MGKMSFRVRILIAPLCCSRFYLSVKVDEQFFFIKLEFLYSNNDCSSKSTQIYSTFWKILFGICLCCAGPICTYILNSYLPPP